MDDLLELMPWVPLSSETAQKFWEKEVDYNALYGLAEDPILPMSEIIEKDPTFGAFVKLSGGEAIGITIEDLQKHISDIQVIPQVPEAVKRVFRIAKELYIFGYFRYIFFTASAHYAYLALESAIKNRYATSLGDRAILTNPTGQRYEIRPPSWERIFEFCKRHREEGWSARKIKVNGEYSKGHTLLPLLSCRFTVSRAANSDRGNKWLWTGSGEVNLVEWNCEEVAI